MDRTDLRSWPGYGHVFIWSPRRLKFVHYWTEGACPHACPWKEMPVTTVE